MHSQRVSRHGSRRHFLSDKAAPVVSKAPIVKPSLSKVKTPIIQRKCACGGTPGPSGLCPSCEQKKKEVVQRKSAGGSGVAVPAMVSSVISSPGRPLDTSTRSNLEGKFGQDLGKVRVHTDSRAAESAKALNAHAYTVGQNIVFDRGKYDPVSPGGKHLLAHEVAHTIQQGGLQRSAVDSLEVSPEYSALEHEADRAADSVVSGRSAPVIAKATHPMVSRQPTTQVTTSGPGGSSSNPSSPQVVPGSTSAIPTPDDLDQEKLNKAGVVQVLDTDPPGGVYRVFVIGEFKLLASKGPLAQKMYENFAANNQLRATIDLTGKKPSAGASQARDTGPRLHASWLQKVGWSKAKAASNWAKVGGLDQKTFLPKLSTGVTCDMDHIVELQVSGTNVPENVQVLDPSQNRSAGSLGFDYLKDLAEQIKAAHKSKAPDQVTMVFRSVKLDGSCPSSKDLSKYTGYAPSCIALECRVLESPEPSEKDPALDGATSLQLYAGASSTPIYLFGAEMEFTDPKAPQNRRAMQLVPGFLLKKYVTGSAGKSDTVVAEIDGETLPGRTGKTKLPKSITITDQANPKFKAERVEGDASRRNLKFDNMTDAAVKLNYPYMSPGDLQLTYSAESGLKGSGNLYPSLPLLKGSALKLQLGEGLLKASLGADVSKWRPLGPATVTRAELSASLLPELGGEGNLDIAFGPVAKPYATANLNTTLNSEGLSASGTLKANIPRVDKAEGKITYRYGVWSGQIRIESTQLKIPSVTSCSVVIDITGEGVRPSGAITLSINGNPVELSATIEKDVWVFGGSATLSFKPLEPTLVKFKYSNGVLTGSGSGGFTYRGLRGTIKLHYEEGVISGDGTLDMTRGRMSGNINAHLLPSGVITGDGSINYQLTPSLAGTVGISINEQQNVRLTGELKFTKPIQLFQRFGSNKEIFRKSADIPIAGVSLGVTSIGLVFRLTGTLGADYGIGPGEIHDLHLSAGFNPFDENPNYELQGRGRLVIPATAGFTVGLRGALAVSGGVASISGGVTATARVGLQLNASNDLTIAYKGGRYTVENVARIIGQPELDFGLSADVEAEVGGGLYRYYKAYKLASYKLGSDMQFGLEAPIRYASDEPFKAPGLDKVKLITPTIDVDSIMRGMLRKVGAA